MTIGFIGLGNMGSGLAKNLLAKDFKVLGFDVDETKQVFLESFGLQKANNVDEIATVCELVILCLPHPDVSRSVIFEQLLVDGNSMKTIIETSTLTPEIVREFSDELMEKDVQFLSSPMIGGKNHATNGMVEFLVEGPKQAFEDCHTIFEAMGSRARFMGDIPSATLAKLSFNLSRYANLASGVEIYRLLEKYNVNISIIYEFISEQSLDNFGQVWKEDLKEMMTVNTPFKPSKVPKKDLTLLSEIAKSHGLDESLIEAIHNTYLSME